MSVKITQPFAFDSKMPNFERDIINSSAYSSQKPYILNNSEQAELSGKYDVGHIVWDINTRRNYRFEYSSGNYKFVALDPLTMTTQEWYNLGNSYIPQYGEVIVFTDNKTVDGVNVPMFKVGDGTHTATELPFSAASYAEEATTAEKVAHQLHIGPHDYDGSAEVTIGLYDGSYEIDDESESE